MTKLRPIAKAIVAAAIPGLTAAVMAVLEALGVELSLSLSDAVTLILSGLVSGGGVYITHNTPKD